MSNLPAMLSSSPSDSESQQWEFVTLLKTKHWCVDAEYTKRIVRLVRTSEPLESVSQVNESFLQLNQKLEPFPLRYWGLLFDVRQARPAHNAEIEKAFRENRTRSYSAFGRYGVLVGTAAGRMQVRRMLTATPDPRIEVFIEAEDALQWVQAPPDSPLVRDSSS